MGNGKQKRYCHEHDRHHRTASGIANDLEQSLKGFKELSFTEIQMLARIAPICEDNLISNAVQILKTRKVIRKSHNGRKWKILFERPS